MKNIKLVDKQTVRDCASSHIEMKVSSSGLMYGIAENEEEYNTLSILKELIKMEIMQDFDKAIDNFKHFLK